MEVRIPCKVTGHHDRRSRRIGPFKTHVYQIPLQDYVSGAVTSLGFVLPGEPESETLRLNLSRERTGSRHFIQPSNRISPWPVSGIDRV